MVVHRDPFAKAEMVFLPTSYFNAYPVSWLPGAFCVHFAGEYPKAPAFKQFLSRAPLSSWVGWNESFWPNDSAYQTPG